MAGGRHDNRSVERQPYPNGLCHFESTVARRRPDEKCKPIARTTPVDAARDHDDGTTIVSGLQLFVPDLSTVT
jgi:hypothetical protein